MVNPSVLKNRNEISAGQDSASVVRGQRSEDRQVELSSTPHRANFTSQRCRGKRGSKRSKQ